jgi:hypothetical protein
VSRKIETEAGSVAQRTPILDTGADDDAERDRDRARARLVSNALIRRQI